MARFSTTEATARMLAATQHGVVCRGQLREAGCSECGVRRLFAHPRWEVVTDRVIRIAGVPRTDQMALCAAVLDAGPGAVVSHLTAANCFGLTGCALRPITITRLSSTTRTCSLAVVHRVRRLPPRWLTELDGIPTASICRGARSRLHPGREWRRDPTAADPQERRAGVPPPGRFRGEMWAGRSISGMSGTRSSSRCRASVITPR